MCGKKKKEFFLSLHVIFYRIMWLKINFSSFKLLKNGAQIGTTFLEQCDDDSTAMLIWSNYLLK